LAILSGILICSADQGQPPENGLKTSDVVARLTSMDEARLQSLQEYSSVRRYTLENTRFGTAAEMRVRMSYQYPGAKKFEIVSEQGSAIIRKSVLHRLVTTETEASQPQVRAATRITADNYNFSFVEMGAQNGRPCYVLEVKPKAPTKYHFVGRIWVDAEDFAVTRIEGAPAVKPSIWISKTAFVHTYKKVGSFWLPKSNTSESDVRVYGKTVVKVEYGDYQINASNSAAAPSTEGVRSGDNQ
jgi:hypothetical protein